MFDCLRALESASRRCLLCLATFDSAEHDRCESLERGDCSWVDAGRVMALACPSSRRQWLDGFYSLTAEDYLPILRHFGVGCVVRLNRASHSKSVFVRSGIDVIDLCFQDGGCPKCWLCVVCRARR